MIPDNQQPDELANGRISRDTLLLLGALTLLILAVALAFIFTPNSNSASVPTNQQPPSEFWRDFLDSILSSLGGDLSASVIAALVPILFSITSFAIRRVLEKWFPQSSAGANIRLGLLGAYAVILASIAILASTFTTIIVFPEVFNALSTNIYIQGGVTLFISIFAFTVIVVAIRRINTLQRNRVNTMIEAVKARETVIVGKIDYSINKILQRPTK